MRTLGLVTLILLALAACNHDATVLHMLDADHVGDGPHLLDGDHISDGSNGSCPVPPWVFPNTGTEPAWVTNSCTGGCPGGTYCIYAAIANTTAPLGCAPLPAACGAIPTCSCMSCVCGGDSSCVSGSETLICQTPTAG